MADPRELNRVLVTAVARDEFSFQEGIRTARRVIEDLVVVVSLQDLPVNVIVAAQASGQGVERQMNSNPAFIAGILAVSYEVAGLFQGAQNV